MRTAKIEINKKEYLLCFSARVMRDCSERYGNAENIGKALTEGTEAQKMDESFWLLSAMMDAGAKYAKVEGVSTPPPLSYDTLYDLCGMDDLLDLKRLQKVAKEELKQKTKKEKTRRPLDRIRCRVVHLVRIENRAVL